MKKFEIEYKGKQYPAFEVRYEDIFEGENGGYVDVSVMSLWEAMEDDYYCEDREAIEVDDSIFFYVDDDFIKSNPTYEELVEHITNCIFPIIEC